MSQNFAGLQRTVYLQLMSVQTHFLYPRHQYPHRLTAIIESIKQVLLAALTLIALIAEGW